MYEYVEACNEVCGCPATTQVIEIDTSSKLQEFSGFGTSLAWFAFVLGNSSNPYRQQVVDLLFDTDTGLGLNAGRYLIEGGENPDLDFIQFRDMIPSYEPK